MKKLVALLVVTTALVMPVRATEIALKLDDGTQNAVLQLPALLDQCVSGMTMRADASVCRSISQFLQSVAGEVRNTQTAVAKKAAEEAAAKEAAKAEADKAKAEPAAGPSVELPSAGKPN